MKRIRLVVGLLGALAAHFSLNHLVTGGQGAMVRKAEAEEAKVEQALDAPPARDPNIAVAEEYEMAKAKGTVEALELFIARHPDHPLAEKARADLKRLSR